jgi:hypothetical protein
MSRLSLNIQYRRWKGRGVHTSIQDAHNSPEMEGTALRRICIDQNSTQVWIAKLSSPGKTLPLICCTIESNLKLIIIKLNGINGTPQNLYWWTRSASSPDTCHPLQWGYCTHFSALSMLLCIAVKPNSVLVGVIRELRSSVATPDGLWDGRSNCSTDFNWY